MKIVMLMVAVMLTLAVPLAFAQDVAQEKTADSGAKVATTGGGSHDIIGTNLRGRHHGEILVLKRDAKGPGGSGYFFNSLSIADGLTAEEFDKRFRVLDAEKLKQQLGGDVVRLNGPRRSMYDSAVATASDDGKVTMIDGTIPMYVYGSIKVPDLNAFADNKQKPYTEISVQRTTQWIFNAGQPVYQLVSPKGSVFVLQSSSLQLNPDNSVEKLSTLGERLALPEGWQFRVQILKEQLIVQAVSGSRPATIVLDEFENNWQRIDKPSVTGANAQETSPAEPKVLADGVGAKMKRVENMHKVRYIELFLAYRDAKAGNLVAGCYNPMFSPAGIPASKDTAPQALVEGLDFDKMKSEYNLIGASLNGPKLWMPDWAEGTAGVERDFNGIKASWLGYLNMDKGGDVSDSTPYKPMTLARESGIGWNKGTTVLLIDDAEGNTWVMKGFQLGLTPKYTYEEFVAAGQSQFKKLPPGWKFRVKTLDKDLIETPENGVATIMPDEFFNMYDKTGPGMSNYTP